MSANLFKTIRKSYIVHLFCTSIVSNLVVFGQPLQQVLTYGNNETRHYNTPAYTINNDKYENNSSSTISSIVADKTPEISKTYYAIEKQGTIGKSFESYSDDAMDNIFSISLPEDFNAQKYDAVLVYELYGLANGTQTTKSINNNSSYGGKVITTTNDWISVREEIPGEMLKTGGNEIFFNRRTEEIYQYKISNLRIELKAKENKEIHLIESLSNLEGTVYIVGSVSKPEVRQLKAMGQNIPVNNGLFEHVLTNVSKDIKDIEISYEGASGVIYKEAYPVGYQSKGIRHQFTGISDESISKDYSINDLVSSCSTYHALGITIDESFGKEIAGKIIVQGLGFKDLKPLDADLKNVTSGDFLGYRIKKLRLSDSVAVQLRIKYDPDMIPEGYTAQDVRTFYFDKSQRNWKALPVDSLDYDNREIVTRIYSNETDFINGVIKVPESPETGSFAPTIMSDMKYADPTAGIVSIAPPSPNSSGTASTSFPIKLPQGRNGMQPSLAVTYNSEGGNGWMGMGWNLSTPAITLNTKWGVPTFGEKETEIYSLNGEDLVFKENGAYGAPHRMGNVSRHPEQSERRFYLRKEGSYQKIIRHGNSPSTYWWEVTDKQGNKSFYGGNGTSLDTMAIIRDGNTHNIAHWALKRTQDPFGNYVDYTYFKGQSVISTSGVKAQEFYLSKIKYTMRSGVSSYYEIDFKRDTYTVAGPGENTSFTPRKDVIVSARNGFLQLTDERLTEVHVSFFQGSTSRIRTYRFNYSDDTPFNKTLLTKISEFDTNGQLFYSNSMEYYNDIGAGAIIQGGLSFNNVPGNDNLSYPTLLTGIVDPTVFFNGSVLGTSVSDGFSTGLRVGLGLGTNVTSVSNTLGGSFSYSKSTQEGRISFFDVNGDGLPDKVYNGSSIKYRPNIGDGFGDAISIGTVNTLNYTKSRTTGFGFDANAFGLIGVGTSSSTTKSDTDNYFTDFNGDGLPDWVSGNKVRFNTTTLGQDNTYRYFTPDANSSENPIVPGPVDPSIVPYLRFETMNELKEEHPQFDHVKVWQAPYAGPINITGSAVIRHKNTDSANHPNSFHISIEKSQAGSDQSFKELEDDLVIVNSGKNMEKSLTVNKGDLIFFRIHNDNYGYGGEVEWNPSIVYINLTNIPYPALIRDEHGKYIHTFNAQNDFTINNGGSIGVNNGDAPTLYFNLPSYGINQFSDDIVFKIRHTRVNTTNGVETEVLTKKRIYKHATGTFDITSDPISYTPVLASGNYKDIFYFSTESTSNVDWGAINWKPLYVTGSETRYPGVTHKTYDNNVNEKKYWFRSTELVAMSSQPAPIEENQNLMVVRHTFFDNPGFFDPIDESEFPFKINWVVKQKINDVSSTPCRKTFYVHRINGTYVFTHSPNPNDVITPALNPDYYKYTFSKAKIWNIKASAGLIYSAFYIDDKRVGENNPAQIILELSPDAAGYSFTPIGLDRPFMASSANLYGYSHRGWGQFLYNGGIRIARNEENEITDPNNIVANYGTSPIEVSLFDFENQAGSMEDVDPAIQPGDVPTQDTAVRYTFYGQENQNSKFVNEGIKEAIYGLNANGQLTATIGRFAEASLYDVYVDPNSVTQVDPGFFLGMKQRSESKGHADSGYLPAVSGTQSTASTEVLSCYADMNGDRYPDLVSGIIQYTNMQGGLSNITYNPGFFTGDESEDRTQGVSVPAIFPNSTESEGETDANAAKTNANAGINTSNGTSYNSKQWVDMNGDGLPDKVRITGDNVEVWLNLGYKFSDTSIMWGSNYGNMVTSTRGNIAVGGGISFGSSFAMGLGGAKSTANMNTALIDVNGDGLPDLVRKGTGYQYNLNNGKEFVSPPKTFYSGSAIEQDVSVTGNIFGSFTGGIPIGPFFGITIKITFSPSLGTNASFSEKTTTVQDINGDGLPEVLVSSSSNNNGVQVNLNKVGKTNILKKVNTPLGGSWTVDYTASTKNYDMPHHKWLLTKIETNDGFIQDNGLRPGGTLTTVLYDNGKYDRREREFLGFGKVTVQQRDATTPATVFRSMETTYHNENYYLSGMQKQSRMLNQSNQVLSEEQTLYNLLDPDLPMVNLNASEEDHFMQVTLSPAAESFLDRSRLFIAAVRTTSTSYEGGLSLSAVKEFTSYDANGNLKVFVDYGVGPEDTYRTEMEYQTSISGLDNAVGFPKKISVKNSGGILMRQREAEYNAVAKGKPSMITTKLNGTDSNRIKFSYDIYGNLVTIEELDNLNALGNTAIRTIGYDSTLFTYPTSITSPFGEISTTEYNYFFGIPVLTTDMNGERMRTRIDDRGRVVEVTGPNEMYLDNNLGNGSAWTIRMQYKGEVTISGSMPSNQYVLNALGNFQAITPGASQPTASQHYAVTRHFDPEYAATDSATSSNQLLTVIIVDGFGQPIQVKKTHFSKTNETASEISKWIVTGFDKKDAYGRTTDSYLPVVQTYTSNPNTLGTSDTNYLNITSFADQPLKIEYDNRDRVTKITQPAESQATSVSYTIMDGMFVEKIKNELSQKLDTYTDIRGRKRKTVQNDEITTTFEYNTINELTKVTDNAGFETDYFYDLAGRQTESRHPDRGIITFKYNKAGNIIEQSTSNLLSVDGLKIEYSYDYNRLVKVEYPQIPQNNVTYTYGKPQGDQLADANNAVGRLLYLEDASGVQIFGYGRMGEVNRNLRSVAVAGYQSFWFFTLWKYDSWNRVQEITYPDLEVVKYEYNSAGMLKEVYSTFPNINPTPPSIQKVVKAITYNDYGERTKIIYGNNTETNYAYDARRRMNMLGHKFINMQINNKYEYDVLSNITGITTQQPQNSLPPTNAIGGPVKHMYQYDNYNRLVDATGTYTGSGDINTPYLRQDYQLHIEYNTDHTIRRKEQIHTQGVINSYGGAINDERPVRKTSYILDYQNYGTGTYAMGTGEGEYGYQQPHAPRRIVESPAWAGASDQYIKSKDIKYDANGNQTEIKQKMGSTSVSLRKNLWDEENRLAGVNLKPDESSNHPIAIYTYDAGGERVVRYNLDHIDVSSNADEVGELRKDNVMIYPNGLVMGKVIHANEPEARNEMVYTKHYYIGSERVSAKTGTISILGNYPTSWLANQMPPLNGTSTMALSDTIEERAREYVKMVYRYFGVQEPILDSLPEDPKFSPRHDGNKLNYYYFHKDHLGSSAYISNFDGKVTQHMEYMPFGETFADEHLNSFNSPFKFNAKEFDEETGNYYYSARYYDPKWSIFISVDPLVEQTGDAYGYCYQNPINLVDPTGMQAYPPPSDMDTPDGFKHTDDTGTWIFNQATNVWEGQDGAEDYTNSILIETVVVNSPAKPKSAMDGYFNPNYDTSKANPCSPPLYLFNINFSIRGGTTMWGADRSGDVSGLKGITRDSFVYDEFVAPSGGGGHLKALSGFSARARILDLRNEAITITKALPGGWQAGDAIGSGILQWNDAATVNVDTTYYILHCDTRRVEGRTGPMPITGTPEAIERSKDSIREKNKFYENWFDQ